MDIDLLSRMVKELILDQDRVVLPGLGTFVAEMVPAAFSDRGYTVNPPYRKLYFRHRLDEDNSLARLYSTSNNISLELAESILTDFLNELRQVLKEKKVVVFPGLGRLRATKENNFFFVPDEDLDIYPEGIGLEPVSMKTHQESGKELTEAVENLMSIIDSGEHREDLANMPEVPSDAAVPAGVEEMQSPEAADDEVLTQEEVIDSGTDNDADGIMPGNTAETYDADDDGSVGEEDAGTSGDVLETDNTPGPVAAGVADVTESETCEVVAAGVADVTESETGEVVAAGVADVTESETCEVVAAGVADVAAGDDTGLPVKDLSADNAAEAAEDTGAAGKKTVLVRALKIAAVCIAVIVALLVIFAVLGQTFPGMFDNLLYNKEQLRILDSVAR